jgi:hypothetical protein
MTPRHISGIKEAIAWPPARSNRSRFSANLKSRRNKEASSVASHEERLGRSASARVIVNKISSQRGCQYLIV